MLALAPRRALPALSRRSVASIRLYSSPPENTTPANNPDPKPFISPVSKTNAVASSSEGSFDKALQESVEDGERRRTMQAPNREGVWSRSQKPRAEAMIGPRFEQTIMEDQPRPYAAIDLIHRQPVRWTKERKVSCDGGGGPLGHPRIFINVDKPQICACTYCGLPFANIGHRKFLETTNVAYPLDPTDDPAQLPLPHTTSTKTGSTERLQSNTGKPLSQR